jgi:hypothetical protein
MLRTPHIVGSVDVGAQPPEQRNGAHVAVLRRSQQRRFPLQLHTHAV